MNLREKSRMLVSMLMNTCFFGHHFPHKDRDPDQGSYKAAPNIQTDRPGPRPRPVVKPGHRMERSRSEGRITQVVSK